MRVAVVGASGRMGRAIVRLASAAGDSIAWAVAATDLGRDVGELAGVGPLGVRVEGTLGSVELAAADVVIDFSAPAVTIALAPLVAAAGVALVTGTTGLDEASRAALAMAASRAPVLAEPNMSVGVHVLARLVEQAVSALGDFDVEIVETHHGAKVDAPSGTALRLADVAAKARAADSHQVHGRQGRPGARPRSDIGMHAVRGGDVIGDHEVHLLGPGERLELTHRATSRDVFAHGALRAARWLVGKPAGAYTLRQVLGTLPQN
jgi:4-hydroxy-tetrahydrodipicolinate reductase